MSFSLLSYNSLTVTIVSTPQVSPLKSQNCTRLIKSYPESNYESNNLELSVSGPTIWFHRGCTKEEKPMTKSTSGVAQTFGQALGYTPFSITQHYNNEIQLSSIAQSAG